MPAQTRNQLAAPSRFFFLLTPYQTPNATAASATTVRTTAHVLWMYSTKPLVLIVTFWWKLSGF